jgi:broad-specificity NMP kinase
VKHYGEYCDSCAKDVDVTMEITTLNARINDEGYDEEKIEEAMERFEEKFSDLDDKSGGGE